VTGIGEQRERVGEPPSNDLDQEEDRCDHERCSQAAYGRRMIVGVRSTATVRVGVPVV